MEKITRLFYNPEDNWKKASKRVNRLGLGQLIFWIASSLSIGGTAAKSGAQGAGFFSLATVFTTLLVLLVIINIMINFNFFKCVKKAKGTSFAPLLQGQKSLLLIDLIFCFLPFAIISKFLFWRGYRQMSKS